ncbi:hypothetical protein A0O30_14490 [Pseudomonas sp. LLC-1]|uniref:hypothetical protein n=1 Tax=Pseudomonas sp. LLC-1 TaxID=1812180 RepID=UPI000D01AD41|nr:hypothetical protein [Pseudomonas sp. LLC-1]PRN04386.1 hypothetical protein A0O30_14490 [Pseudomonas sp. LLC-1]
MSDQDQQIIGYWYQWGSTTTDGEITMPSAMVKLTSNTRAKVLSEIARHFSTLNKVITFNDGVIPAGPARHYNRANATPLTVRIDGDTPLNLFIYEAGDTIQLMKDSPRH